MKYRQPSAAAMLLGLVLAAIAASTLPVSAANKPLPFTVPVSGMRLDPAMRNQVSGLALTLEDAGWPDLSMLGHPYGTIGALCKTSDSPNESWSVRPMSLGMVRMGDGGHLADQQVNDVTNTLTYLNDHGESLKVTMTQLSPAVLIEASGNELELFGAADKAYAQPDSKNVPKQWDPAHQAMAPIPKAQQGPFEPGAFPPPPGCVKPLRWATCGADGSVVTGVLGSQPALAFPFIDWHKRFAPVASLAPEKSSSPPTDGLGQHWLLLWYGSGSPFLSSKLPAVFAGGEGFHVFVPWRLETVFQADVPILLVFEKTPQSIELRQDGNVPRLAVTYPGSAGKVVMLPLFGHDLQSAATTEKWLSAFPADLKTRCDDWAKRLDDFPVNVTEQTVHDAKADRVTSTETFDYVTVRPGGAKTALVPPMLALGLEQKLPAVVTPSPVDLKYATQFGPLLGVAGDTYQWHVDGLGKYVDGKPVIGPETAQSIVLEKELSAEVDKVLAAGHLAPWIVSRQAPWCSNFGTTYGKDPSQVLYFMSEFLPLLPPPQQAKVRDYLASEATAYPPEKVVKLNIKEGARREFCTIPPNLFSDYDRTLGVGAETDEYYEKVPSLFRAYGVARYYLATERKPTTAVVEFWRDAMRESLAGRDWATLGWYWGKYATLRPAGPNPSYREDYWQYTPRAIHRDAAGLIGYLRLCQLSNVEAEPEAWGQLVRLMAFRFALARYGRYQLDSGLFQMPTAPAANKHLARSGDFSNPENQFEQVWEVNQHEVTMYSGVSLIANGHYSDGFLASPNDGSGNNQVVFADLTPEVGCILADWGLNGDVARFVKHYAAVQPIWYKSYSDSEQLSESELGLVLPSDSYQYFVADAWIAGTPSEELEHYIDEPWAAVGDFFFMNKLAQTIKAYRGDKWEAVK